MDPAAWGRPTGTRSFPRGGRAPLAGGSSAVLPLAGGYPSLPRDACERRRLLSRGSGAARIAPAPLERIEERTRGCEASLILCATRTSRSSCTCRPVSDRQPGSVGIQAYEGHDPGPHRVEMGAPHARYAVAERRENGWRWIFAVAYDWNAAARLAEQRDGPIGCARSERASSQLRGLLESRSIEGDAAAAPNRESNMVMDYWGGGRPNRRHTGIVPTLGCEHGGCPIAAALSGCSSIHHAASGALCDR